jgi:hypothetical protein
VVDGVLLEAGGGGDGKAGVSGSMLNSLHLSPYFAGVIGFCILGCCFLSYRLITSAYVINYAIDTVFQFIYTPFKVYIARWPG